MKMGGMPGYPSTIVLSFFAACALGAADPADALAPSAATATRTTATSATRPLSSDLMLPLLDVDPCCAGLPDLLELALRLLGLVHQPRPHVLAHLVEPGAAENVARARARQPRLDDLVDGRRPAAQHDHAVAH